MNHTNRSSSPDGRMELPASAGTMQVALSGAVLEVALGEAISAAPPGASMICAAHPAEGFGLGTAQLLQAAAEARVICVSPRGLGGSSPVSPGQQQTLEGMVDDLEAVRRRLGLAPWVFWGMSGGGWLGQLYARKYPEALTGLVLESICPCFRARLADPACLLSPLHPSWRAPLASQGLIAADAHAEVGDASDTEWIDVEGVGAVFRRRRGPALLVSPMPVSPAMGAAMPQLWTFDARPWLAELRVPTLVICGTADPVVPVAHAQALQAGIAGAKLLLLEGGGHVPVAQGHPKIGEAVRSFLRDRVSQRSLPERA